MANEDSTKLRDNFITRNGNVWHSFDKSRSSSYQFSLATPSRSSSSVQRSPLYIKNKSERFTMIHAQRSRRSLVSNRKQKSQRSTRLRSFSAQASAQAIRFASENFVAK